MARFLNPIRPEEGQSALSRSFTQIQEVPEFCDFWYQKGITKFGDHEF